MDDDAFKPPRALAVHGVRAVLPDRVLEDATIIIEDGRIASIESNGTRPPGSIDGSGAFCLPGLIDSHSDGLEKEINPRPGVMLPEAFALRSFEARMRSAGITTVFHGIGFEDDPHYARTVDLAHRLADAVQDRRRAYDSTVEHRILYRLDARDPSVHLALCERFAAKPDPLDPAPLVSFEDHTPGQGQYRDIEFVRKGMATSPKYAGRDVDEALAERMALRESMAHNREHGLARLRSEAIASRLRIVAHDPTTRDDIAEARTWPAEVAEFPTTLEAARAAREFGLPSVMGAPNVLRGGSHSGNVSAESLVRENLCTTLASDYQPAAMLAAVFLLAKRGAASPPRAVRLVTDGPAGMVGLQDRGRLEVGLRADLLLCTFDGTWPTVQQVWRGPIVTTAPTAPTAAPTDTRSEQRTADESRLVVGASR